MVGEGLAQRIARIVVARNQVDRHGKRRQQAPETGIFLELAAVHQIAGGDHEIGPRIERIEVRHRPLEETGRIDAAIEQLAFDLHVHVGDLGDQHGTPSVVLSGAKACPERRRSDLMAFERARRWQSP